MTRVPNGPSSTALSSMKFAALKSREVLLKHFKNLSQVSDKGQLGLVSVADREAEETIRTLLEKDHPDIGFFGEESHFDEGGDQKFDESRDQWVVDPLDGTTNFVYGFPVFCTSLALWKKGKIEAAVVDIPFLNKTYSAEAGQGAFCNGEPIYVKDRDSIEDSLLATGFNGLTGDKLRIQLEAFSELVGKSRGLRRAGSAAFDLCMVAEGIFNGFWEFGLKPWDTAGGALLIKEAGGQVTNGAGKPFRLEDPSIVAGGNQVHQLLLNVLKTEDS